MSIAVTCSGCHSNYNVPDSMGGKKAKCTKCGAVLMVPAVDTDAAAPSSPPSSISAASGSSGLDWNALGMGSSAGSAASAPQPAVSSGGGLFDDLDPPGEYRVAPANSIDEALAMANSAPTTPAYGGAKNPLFGGGQQGSRTGYSSGHRSSSPGAAIGSGVLCFLGTGLMFLLLVCSGSPLLAVLVGLLGFAATVGCAVTGFTHGGKVAWSVFAGFALICLLGLGKVGFNVVQGVSRAQARAGANPYQPQPWQNPQPVVPGYPAPPTPSQHSPTTPPPIPSSTGGWTPAAIPEPLQKQMRFENWHVQADPLPPWAAVGEGRELTIALSEPDFSHPLWRGQGYSRAIGLLHRVAGRNVVEVWDLASRSKVGEFSKPVDFQGETALSPDAHAFAGAVRAQGRGLDVNVQVWSVEHSELLKELPGPGERARIVYLDFVSPELLLVIGQHVSDRKLQLWNINTGVLVREQSFTRVDWEPDKLFFSPGRKYATLIGRERLEVLEVATGQIVGALTPPQFWRVEAVAFSPDGAEMVALIEGDSALHLLCWQTQSATIVAQHKLAQRKHELLDFEDKTAGLPVSWLSKGGGWLVGGKVVVKREDGSTIWQLPKEQIKDLPAKLLDGDSLLTYESRQSREGQVTLRPFPYTEMDQVAQAVASGGDAIDIHLPPVGQADWSQVQEVDLVTSATWSAQVGARAPLKSGAAIKSLRLTDQRLARILFADPSSAHAVLLDVDARSPVNQELHPTVASQLQRLDLVAGTSVNVTVPGGSELLAISPSGERAALLIGSDDARIDLYSLGEKPTHEGAWRPYANAEGDARDINQNRKLSNRSVIWADFIAETRLLTLSHFDGELVLWQVPERKAVYRLRVGKSAHAALSPDRKYIALLAGNRIVMLDALTGKSAGEMQLPIVATASPHAQDAFSFSDDGTRLAVTVVEGADRFLFAYDLKTGQKTGEASLPFNFDQIQWHDERQLFASTDNRHSSQVALVDLDRKVIVWRYAIQGGYWLPAAPDKRMWMVAAMQNYAPTLVVQPFGLEPEVKAALATLPLNPPPLFGPGATVTLDAGNVGGGIGASDLSSKVQAAWTSMLQSRGAKVGAGSGVRLTGSCTPGKTRTEAYRVMQFGIRSANVPHEFSLTLTDYDLQMQLVDSSGKVLWKKETRAYASGPGSFSNLPDGVSPQQHLTERIQAQQSAAVESFFKGCRLPYMVYAQPADANGLPGLGASTVNLVPFALPSRSGGSPGVAGNGPIRPGPTRPGAAQSGDVAASRFQSLAESLYAKALAENPQATSDHWQYCAGLERPIVAIRWGLGVQIDVTAEKAREQLQPQVANAVVLRELERAAGLIGPHLVQMLRTKTAEGKFGSFAGLRDAELREVVYLGAGGRTQLATAARKAGVDVVILVKLERIERGRLRDASLTLEMLDLASSKKLWTSNVQLESKVAAAKREGLDLLKSLSDECGLYIDENLKLTSFESMPSTTASARVEAGLLHRTNPLASLAEVDIYLTRELVTPPQAAAALTKLLGSSTHVPELAGSDQSAREDALETVIPILRKKLE